ncbi:MAG: flavodoxin domain-containing protein [Solobacterium sp.]|nr:flavodoxin domain-containing protein [Solobacterium sp.]
MTVVNVLYQSRTGNTEKVAEAIAEVCGVKAADINKPNNITGSDLLFVGMGIYNGKPDNFLLDYLDQLPANTIKGAALFSTSGRGTDQMELAVNLLEHKGIQIYPKHLLLKGSVLFFNKGKPGEAELNEAREFAGEVLAAFNY